MPSERNQINAETQSTRRGAEFFCGQGIHQPGFTINQSFLGVALRPPRRCVRPVGFQLPGSGSARVSAITSFGLGESSLALTVSNGIANAVYALLRQTHIAAALTN